MRNTLVVKLILGMSFVITGTSTSTLFLSGPLPLANSSLQASSTFFFFTETLWILETELAILFLTFFMPMLDHPVFIFTRPLDYVLPE